MAVINPAGVWVAWGARGGFNLRRRRGRVDASLSQEADPPATGDAVRRPPEATATRGPAAL